MSGTPLTDAINALTTYANSVTGKTPPDTTLSDAVATLASGYGGGGSAPTGFVEEYSYTIESAITASNNNISLINTVCPATLDDTDFNCYLFFVTNNTASTKRALFALWQRTGAGVNNRAFTSCRWNSAPSITWASGAADWYLSAGSVIHVLKFNSLLGME